MTLRDFFQGEVEAETVSIRFIPRREGTDIYSLILFPRGKEEKIIIFQERRNRYSTVFSFGDNFEDMKKKL